MKDPSSLSFRLSLSFSANIRSPCKSRKRSSGVSNWHLHARHAWDRPISNVLKCFISTYGYLQFRPRCLGMVACKFFHWLCSDAIEQIVQKRMSFQLDRQPNQAILFSVANTSAGHNLQSFWAYAGDYLAIITTKDPTALRVDLLELAESGKLLVCKVTVETHTGCAYCTPPTIKAHLEIVMSCWPFWKSQYDSIGLCHMHDLCFLTLWQSRCHRLICSTQWCCSWICSTCITVYGQQWPWCITLQFSFERM